MRRKTFLGLFLLVISTLIIQAQERQNIWNDLENPKMFDQNKEAAHASFIPFKGIDAALTKKKAAIGILQKLEWNLEVQLG